MANKYEFIKDLLKDKRITVFQRERILELATDEIRSDGTLEERIQKIETIVYNSPTISINEEIIDSQTDKANNKSTGKQKENSPQSPQHKPKHTKNFLSIFNDSEGLKYLTHPFNKQKPNYKDFIELCRKEFNAGRNKYPYTRNTVLKRIKVFAFDDKPDWYIRNGHVEKHFYIGWSEPLFIKWYQKPVNTHPSYDNKWKTEMIKPFQESIEVRAGNLSKIIDETLSSALGNSISTYNIRKDNDKLDTAEFYTDVDLFKLVLIRLFSTIADIAVKNLCFELSISYENETINGGKFKKLIISHIDSEATKYSTDPEFAKGDIKTIKNNLWGLCNYEIMAKFPDGYKKKIFLTDDPNDYRTYVKENKTVSVDSNIVDGFTHILKFY